MHTVTNLEDRLANDALGCARRELQFTLEAAVTELCRQQRAPQPAAHYAALGRQRIACMAALQVIDTVWDRCHRAGMQFRP